MEMIRHFAWNQDVSEEQSITHTQRDQPLSEVIKRISQLDGYEYVSVCISLDVDGLQYPKLFICGDQTGYAVFLNPANTYGEWNNESYSYINPVKALQLAGYRAFGKTYPGLEVAARFLTANIEVVSSLVACFAETGQWKPGVTFIIERNDDDGLVREYDQVQGEYPYDSQPDMNEETDLDKHR